MNTPIFSAIIVSVLATTVFVLPLAIVYLILAFVPTERLAVLTRLLVHRRGDGGQTPTITDLPRPTTIATTDQRADDPATRDDSAAALGRQSRLGYFIIETVHVERTRLLVEMFLERETKRWRLDGSTGKRGAIGQIPKSVVLPSTLLYLVRFRRSSRVETVRDRLKAIGESSDFTVRLECDDDLIARSA